MKPNMLSSYYNTFSAPNTVQMWISVDFDGNIFDNSIAYNFYRMQRLQLTMECPNNGMLSKTKYIYISYPVI